MGKLKEERGKIKLESGKRKPRRSRRSHGGRGSGEGMPRAPEGTPIVAYPSACHQFSIFGESNRLSVCNRGVFRGSQTTTAICIVFPELVEGLRASSVPFVVKNKTVED